LKHGWKGLKRISLLLEFNVNTFSTMSIWRFSAVAKQANMVQSPWYLSGRLFPLGMQMIRTVRK